MFANFMNASDACGIRDSSDAASLTVLRSLVYYTLTSQGLPLERNKNQYDPPES